MSTLNLEPYIMSLIIGVAGFNVLLFIFINREKKRRRVIQSIIMAMVSELIQLKEVSGETGKNARGEFLSKAVAGIGMDFWAKQYDSIARNERFLFWEDSDLNDGFDRLYAQIHAKIFKEYYCTSNGLRGFDICESNGEKLIMKDICSGNMKKFRLLNRKNKYAMLDRFPFNHLGDDDIDLMNTALKKYGINVVKGE